MTRRRTDFKLLKVKRDKALHRPELTEAARSQPVDRALIAAAIAAGRYTKLPTRKTRS
jgi:hypothetical protein